MSAPHGFAVPFQPWQYRQPLPHSAATPWPPFAPQYSAPQPAGPGYFAAPTGFGGYRPAPAGHSKQAMLLTVGVLGALVVALLLILGFGAPGWFLTRQLDVRQAQSGVESILTDPAGYGAKNVNNIVCNGGHNPTVTKGATFTCEATVDGVRWQFPVRFTDRAGNYQVGRPQ